MKVIFGISLLSLLFVIACKVEPEEINYGHEACHFCQMTIVDRQHAAEVVTDKGKVFKFDAIECMINDLKSRDSSQIGLLLINDYNSPGKLIPAATATYLISEAIASPMGAFLSGFSHSQDAEVIKTAKGGTLYSWQSVQKQLRE